MPSTTPSLTDPDYPVLRGTHLVQRNRLPRWIGVILCGICIASALKDQQANWLHVVLAPYFLVVWPLFSYEWARRSRDPLRAEYINLWMDAVHAGFWIAAMHFAAIPAIALWMATSLSNITVGGPRLVAWGLTGHAVGMALGVAVWGWAFTPESTLNAQMGAAALFVGYPLLMGQTLFRLAMHLKRKQRELRYLSEHDALSGVYNRRHFDMALRQLVHQVKRMPRPITLVVCDVDDFKRINDTLGHAAGDAVIRALGTALMSAARQGDVVARLGGDEFATVLMDATAEQAQGYAARVLAQVQANLTPTHPTVTVSLSVGIAALDAEFDTHERWMEQADQALYRHKAAHKRAA
jgi:diguanylate cyclase